MDLEIKIAEYLITQRNSNPRARKLVNVPLFMADNANEIREIRKLLDALGVTEIPDTLINIPR